MQTTQSNFEIIAFEWQAWINNLTARNLFSLEGETPHMHTIKERGDISNLCNFKWYEWCYFRDQKQSFPFARELLGRVLEPSKEEGNEMCQWILESNGQVVPRRSYRKLTDAELNHDQEKRKRNTFDRLIEERWASQMDPRRQVSEPVQTGEFFEYEDDVEEPCNIPEVHEPVDAQGRTININPAYDKMINTHVQLQKDNMLQLGQVMRRARNSAGNTEGVYDHNPLKNSVIYEVEFPDGQVKEYAANTIAENIYSKVDLDGYSTSMFDGIKDYDKSDEALKMDQRFITTKSNKKRLRQTTIGWKLLVSWKDGSETWVPLKIIKETNPVDVAEFARAKGIDKEPAFAWWVPFTLRKRDIIISKVTARIRRVNQKYGIDIPRTVEEAYKLDEKNGDTFWRDAIAKEMLNVGIAFDILEPDQSLPVGWKKATGHLIFDVKMDFTRKARWVLDGHKCADPYGSTYAGVVSRESVRIGFTYAALNKLDVCVADIKNAYLQAPSSQKDYIICGIEFGLENVGKRALIKRALYGGKAAGRDFRNHLRDCMKLLKFKSCLADPDVWMRPAMKADGSLYYEYILLYTDDALCISENAEKVLREELGKYFTLKEESIGKPKIYLGGQVSEVMLENNVRAWSFSPKQYVRSATDNVWKEAQKRNWQIPRATTPISTIYRPELDTTPELNAQDASYYQSLIGILRWMVELGRIDTCLEVSMMSSHLALPRQGHLQQVLHIFSYLKKHHSSSLVFDPTIPDIDETKFRRMDWSSSEFGGDLQEDLPGNMPEPRGVGFVMRAMVDADHAADTTCRRSRTGFLVYLNSAPIYWMSKKQAGIETSSFGSEFTAMKQCTEYIRGLRYKLRMMGIPVDAPTYIFGDNQSVLNNTTLPDSILKKKSQSICYHFVREGVARNEWRTTYVNTHENPADLLTKPLPAGEKRTKFVKSILHDIFYDSEHTN